MEHRPKMQEKKCMTKPKMEHSPKMKEKKYFSIEGNTRDNYSLTDIKFKVEQKDGTEKYSEEFDIYESTYIKTELSFDNKKYGKEDWLSSFVAKYYEPDGSYFGEFHINASVKSDEQNKVSSKGYGYPNIGYWKPGKYKVEIWDGDEKMGEKFFTMSDNRKSYSSNYKIQFIKF